MRLQTFGAWTGTVGSIGAGALTQSTQYSYLALPLAIASGIVWLCVLAVFLYTHRRDIRARSAKLEPIHLIILGLVIALGGAGWQIFRIPAPHASQVAEQAVPPIASVPAGKFYSPRNKSDLADALTDISGLLNTTGDDIVKRTSRIMRNWDRRYQTEKPTMAHMAELIAQLNDLSAATVVLNRALYDDDGLLTKYKTYGDELGAVLNLPGNSSPQSPITVFQVSVNDFASGVSDIERACKYDDAALVDSMKRNMTPVLHQFQRGDETFNSWLADTRKRIAEFRKSL